MSSVAATTTTTTTATNTTTPLPSSDTTTTTNVAAAHRPSTGGKSVGSSQLHSFVKELTTLAKANEFSRVLSLLHSVDNMLLEFTPKFIGRMEKLRHQKMASFSKGAVHLEDDDEKKNSDEEDEKRDNSDDDDDDEHLDHTNDPIIESAWIIKTKTLKRMLERKDALEKEAKQLDKELQQRILQEFEVWQQDEPDSKPDVYRFVDADLVSSKDYVDHLKALNESHPEMIERAEKTIANKHFYEAVVIRKTAYHLFVRTITNNVFTKEPVEFEIKASVLMRRRSRESVAKLKEMFFQHLVAPPKEVRKVPGKKRKQQEVSNEEDQDDDNTETKPVVQKRKQQKTASGAKASKNQDEKVKSTKSSSGVTAKKKEKDVSSSSVASHSSKSNDVQDDVVETATTQTA